jgi:predicted nucleic acid-binding protein
LLHPFLLRGLKLPILDLAIRDPDDVPILAFAVAAGAGLLITGDRDLLELSKASPVRIVSPREFFNLK